MDLWFWKKLKFTWKQSVIWGKWTCDLGRFLVLPQMSGPNINFIFTYIAEKCYPTYWSSWIVPFSDFFDYINDFWATKRPQEAIKISTDSWDDVLHYTIIYVSRSGKSTVFYIAYISHLDDKLSIAHTVKSDVSRIQGGIHTNTPYNVTIL